jgi:hypothetical protein
MGNILDKYEKGGVDALITFNELQQLPLDKLFSFVPSGAGKAEGLAIETGEEDALTFRAIISKGTVFNSHKHDCIENIIIYKGKMVDLKTGNIIKRGKIEIFHVLKPHHLKALEDTICYIEFEKP